jgi:hypothetical protein
MNREEYIELLLKLANVRFNFDEKEIKEIRTALEAMPDKGGTLTFPRPYVPDVNPFNPNDNRDPFGPVILMYGVNIPYRTDFKPNWPDWNSTTSASVNNETDKTSKGKEIITEDKNNDTGK